MAKAASETSSSPESVAIPAPAPSIIVPTPPGTDIIGAINKQFGGPPVIANPTRHDLDTFTGGEFKDSETGEVFKLKVIPDDEAYMGRTHHLANNVHFREITKEAFRATFEKP